MKALALEGAVAVVSGASGDIGRAITTALAGAGARVVGVDLRDGEGCRYCDVGDSSDVEELVEAVADEYGGLDILVHAAGITQDGVLWKTTDDAWRSVMRVNLDAAFFLLRACAPHLRRSRHASAVLISSINGQRGKFGQSNYAASKAGLIGLAMSAARELGRDGARVNVIAPGLIEGAMSDTLPAEVVDRALAEILLGRLGTPEDVAGVVLFLCSRLARHVTGQVIRVDGGQLIA